MLRYMGSAKKPSYWLCPCSQSFAGGWHSPGRGQVNPGCTVWPGKNATLLIQTSHPSWGSLWPRARSSDCCTEENTEIRCALYRNHVTANQMKPIWASVSYKGFIFEKRGIFHGTTEEKFFWVSGSLKLGPAKLSEVCIHVSVSLLLSALPSHFFWLCFAPVPRVEYGHPIPLKKLTGWPSVPIQIFSRKNWSGPAWVGCPLQAWTVFREAGLRDAGAVLEACSMD